MIPELIGLVLCGGKSRRMGTDKSQLVLKRYNQLVESYNFLKSHLDNIYISCREEQASHFFGLDDVMKKQMIFDVHINIGPAAGFLATHQRFPQQALLVMAVDMPSLQKRDIDELLCHRDSKFDLIAFQREKPEPLFAIWEPKALRQLNANASEGAYSLQTVIASAKSNLLIHDEPRRLASINTSENASAWIRN